MGLSCPLDENGPNTIVFTRVEDNPHPEDLSAQYEGPSKEEAVACRVSLFKGRPEPNIMSSRIRKLRAYAEHTTG
ncbi:unnamed protein product [Lota lota]